MKRILLFLATNIAVLVVLGIVAHLLGADRFLTQNGLNMASLLLFAAVFGFGGSLISLAMSKWMAKRMMGAQVITNPRSEVEIWLSKRLKSTRKWLISVCLKLPCSIPLLPTLLPRA